MITHAKVKQLLSPGDVVYIHDGGVVAETVRKILADCLRTDGGFLQFDEHGVSWWLTEKVAKERYEQCTKIKF